MKRRGGEQEPGLELVTGRVVLMMMGVGEEESFP